jgi:hypothetical protein
MLPKWSRIEIFRWYYHLPLYPLFHFGSLNKSKSVQLSIIVIYSSTNHFIYVLHGALKMNHNPMKLMLPTVLKTFVHVILKCNIVSCQTKDWIRLHLKYSSVGIRFHYKLLLFPFTSAFPPQKHDVAVCMYLRAADNIRLEIHICYFLRLNIISVEIWKHNARWLLKI